MHTCQHCTAAQSDPSLSLPTSVPTSLFVRTTARMQVDITPEQRGRTKRLAYATLYGMGPGSLAVGLGVTVQQAQEMAATFRAGLKGVQSWMHVRRALLHVLTDMLHTQTMACCGSSPASPLPPFL